MASVIISSGPSLADVETYSKEAGLNLYVRPDGKFDVFSTDASAVETYYKQLDPATIAELIIHKLEPRLNVLQRPIDPATFAPGTLKPSTNLSPAGVGGESYFTADQLSTIYNFPTPSAGPYVIGVVSFGGGLYGSVNAEGVLTGGDVQAYWTGLGIPTANHPKVVVVPINGATNTPSMNDGAATSENTLDVETLGALYPRSNVTIILYIAPNSLENFAPLLSYMLNTDVVVGGVNYRPNIVSCSWGAPEVYYSESLLTSINSVMSTMNSAGITICTATGDNGSSNGVASGFISGVTNYVDFPSSSPCSTAVGGTNLVCPTNVYDHISTIESAWTYGGGGVSTYFNPPSYQSALGKSKRSIPDLAAVADPATGVLFFINSTYYVFGGTSVAAPVVCAFLASINCKVFVNPLLYDASDSCFNDITLGNNGGFNTTIAGYDNCTGRGTMRGTPLAAALNAIRVTGVTLNRATASLQVGNPSNNTVQLTATIAPNNASNTDLTWISSSPSATVSNTGLVTAVSAGTATITVQTADGGKTAICVVTVSAFIGVTGVTLNRTTATIATGAGNGVTLVATVLPTNAINKAVTWLSSTPGIATVAPNGRVTGVAPGTTTITVTTTNGSFTASCDVTVVNAVAVTGIGLDRRSAFLATGSTITLIPTIYPFNATNTSINWTSSTPAKATVDIASGLVTAVAAGTTTITATTADGGKVATCVITVYVPPFVNVTGVTLDNSSLTIEPAGTPSLTATVTPAGATNKNLTWSSNSPNVTVDQSGNLRGVSPGIATITVTTENGGYKARCTVLVNAPPVIHINPPTFTVSSGSITNITATVTRPALANTAITWSSSSAIATLPANGSVSGGTGNTTIMSIPVRGISNGTATISATYMGVTATSIVTVFTNVQGIQLNAGNITLSVGNTFQAIPRIIPPTSNNTGVIWSTSAASVAIVSASGLITAKGNGIATVRATTRDGNKSAIISVRVSTGPTSVSINVHTITIARGQSYNLLATVTPQYVSSVAVAWSSANPKIASISSMGVVRALLVGTTTITARITGFPFTDTCVITVV